MRVNDWDEWQSFRKDRGAPPWIKIHRSLMTNPKWAELTDSEKGQLVSLWVAAADNDGFLPDSPAVLRKICQLDQEPNINKFIRLGLMIGELTTTCQPLDNHLTTSCPQLDAPEERRGEERREEEKREDVRPPRVKREAGPPVSAPEFFDEENFEKIPSAALVKISPTSDLPLEWGEYAQKLNWQPDQIMAEWHKLVECFSNGSKAGTRRSVKGWRKTWAGWIERSSRSKL